jgi:hypothetical protein
VSVRSESSSPPAEAGRAGLALLLALLSLTAAWGALHLPFFERYQIIDTPVYQGYGEAMAAGELPYRDFELEYPPGALPLFWLPTLAPSEHFASAFELLVWACAVAAAAFVVLTLNALGASSARLYAAASFVGLAPLALGSVVLTRYDFWPAALAAAALAALVSGRERTGLAALALAVAAKIYPLVLLPPALAYVARRRGGREAAAGLLVFAGVLGLALVPFAILAPEGFVDSLGRQLGRPLQIESLGASLLLAAHQLGLYDATVVSSHGSQNLAGGLPDVLAALQSVVQIAALVAVWILAATRGNRLEALLVGAAASVAAFVAFGKVLSPQYLVWLLPLVPLVAGRLGLAAAALLGAALVTTHLWFPFRYWDVVALEPAAWLVLVRDLLLVALFAVLVAALSRAREAPRSA